MGVGALAFACARRGFARVGCGRRLARLRPRAYCLRMFDAVRGPFVVVVLCGLALVSACSGSGGAPRTLPSLSAPPTMTATPISTTSDLDAVAAAGHRWFDLIQGPTTVGT